MTPTEIKLHGKVMRLEEKLRTERERNDRLLQTNQKLMIHSVHQQDHIDNLYCYLRYYLTRKEDLCITQIADQNMR